MLFRLAEKKDLSGVLDMYKQIRSAMEKNDILIWDDYYPFQFVESDIEKKQLYVLEHEEEHLAALALEKYNAGEGAVKWAKPNGEAVYIVRFGTNVKYWRNGIGCSMLSKTIAEAKRQGFGYLRLFSAAENVSAMNLYRKVGFKQMPGKFYDEIDENKYLLEYGFEIDLSTDSI